ncbi:hypothetical protein [Actinomyces ruminicola]|uniref:hypothetical protein n=1 Tax=Actinomyces ruminicola TaxID=332524 RepID=UPI0021C3EF21|nr:hypothetical protein [Actinomyces ruminicola]
MDINMVGIGRVQLRTGTLVVNGIEVPANIPYEVAAVQMNHLRAAQVLPGRGAWTWCHLWMDASDGVLHQECDWMREPVFTRASGDVRPGPGDCWSELERFPRDDEFIPDWLREGYEAELKRRERNARRREARRRKREQERGGD